MSYCNTHRGVGNSAEGGVMFHLAGVVVGVAEEAVVNDDDDKKEVQDEDAPMRDSRRRSRLVVVVLLRNRSMVILFGFLSRFRSFGFLT